MVGCSSHAPADQTGSQQASDELSWRVRIEFGVTGREAAAAVGAHFWDSWAQCITQPGTMRSWFPCSHNPGQRTTYAFRVTVPAQLMAVCSGQLKQQVRHPIGLFGRGASWGRMKSPAMA